MAVGGGAVNPISNPGGLRSRLCGPAVVASFSVQFEDLNSKD